MKKSKMKSEIEGVIGDRIKENGGIFLANVTLPTVICFTYISSQFSTLTKNNSHMRWQTCAVLEKNFAET